jgi:hypothetical protein
MRMRQQDMVFGLLLDLPGPLPARSMQAMRMVPEIRG